MLTTLPRCTSNETPFRTSSGPKRLWTSATRMRGTSLMSVAAHRFSRVAARASGHLSPAVQYRHRPDKPFNFKSDERHRPPNRRIRRRHRHARADRRSRCLRTQHRQDGRVRARDGRAPAPACQDAQMSGDRAAADRAGAVGLCCQKVGEAEALVTAVSGTCW